MAYSVINKIHLMDYIIIIIIIIRKKVIVRLDNVTQCHKMEILKIVTIRLSVIREIVLRQRRNMKVPKAT